MIRVVGEVACCGGRVASLFLHSHAKRHNNQADSPPSWLMVLAHAFDIISRIKPAKSHV